VDIAAANGKVSSPLFGGGPDPLRAVLAAEQRCLVEQVGSACLLGRTYVDKANERIRRYRETRPWVPFALAFLGVEPAF
jgi:hypothetical protein